MEVHYFQRYNNKENVVTSNTMLLLSRFYYYSPELFYRLINECFIQSNNELKMQFNIQEQSSTKKSVADATITQPGFKIVIETKLMDNFDLDQLINHLDCFENENIKVLLTLNPFKLRKNDKKEIEDKVTEYMKNNNIFIKCIHLTFKELIDKINEISDESNYGFNDILEDFENFCFKETLIPEDFRTLQTVSALHSLEIDYDNNMYFKAQTKGDINAKFIGLYRDKKIHAIGEITKKILIRLKSNSEFDIIDDYDNDISDIEKNRIREYLDDLYNCESLMQSDGALIIGETYYIYLINDYQETKFTRTANGAAPTKQFNLLCIENEMDLSAKGIAEYLYDKNWEDFELNCK